MAWPSAPLREVIAIHYGKSLSAKVRRAGTVPVFGSNGVVGYHDEPLVHHATIVIGRKGSIGELNFCEVPSFPIDTTFYVEVMDASRVSLKYLYRAMKSINLKRHIIAVGVPGINREDIYKEEIPLPPLAEQQRIVEILDRAAAIQRLRRAAEEKAREIIPALFVDMFGDPATNPKAWPVGTLAAVVDEFRYGTSMKSGATGVPVLRIPNVIGGALDTKEIKLVQLTQAELRRLTLADGDLLFVRTNGNPDYVGRSAIYDDQRMIDAGYAPNASVYASYLIRARLNRSVCPAFIQAQLSSAEGRRHFRERSRTSAGQYNINTESLGTIPLMLPPLSLQLAFAEKAKAVTNMSPTTSLAKQTTEGVVSALAASVLG